MADYNSESSKIVFVCLIILASIAVAATLFFTRSFMVPFVLAGFAAFIAAPGVDFLERHAKLPRLLAILTTAGGVILTIIAASLLVVSSVRDAMVNIEIYRASLVGLVNHMVQVIADFGFRDYGRDEWAAKIGELPVFSYFQLAASKIVNALSDLVLIVLIVAFLLSGRSFKLPPTSAVKEIETKIRSYLVTKLFTSAITGFLTVLILIALDVDMAVMFGFLAFILNFIPTIGSMVATLLPLPVALVQFGLAWPTFMAIGLPGIVQFLIGNVYEPKFMGESLDLHPVTILMSLMFWGLIWGVPGMILATPILVIGKIILTQSRNGFFIAELMAGRFYQKNV